MDLTSPALNFFDTHHEADEAIRALHQRGVEVSTRSLEGAVLVGGMSALGAALTQIGFSKEEALRYETAPKADKYVLSVRGSVSDMADANAILSRPHPFLAIWHGTLTQPGRAFAAVRWTQGMVAAFIHPLRIDHPSLQELSPMRVSEAATAACLSVQAPEAGTTAAAMVRSRGDHATLAKRAGAASGGAAVDATLVLWRAADLDVSAVIGHRGTAAVLRRALVIMRRTHGWMPEPPDDADFDACVRNLCDAFAGQAPEERASGQRLLEATFHDLLASLVGAALTTQLLRAAWIQRQARIDTAP